MRIQPTGEVRQKRSLIKYPNQSAALRQHVEQRRTTDKPVTAIRLRPRLAPESTAPDEIRSRPAKTIAVARAHAVETVSPARVPIAHRSTSAEEPVVIRTVLALGDVVRHARRRQGLSQSDLAAAAGTGRRFISELEAGKPTLEFERILKVCNTLDITLIARQGAR